AHGVGEPGASGDDEQWMTPAELAERGAQRAQRIVAGAPAQAAADLDDRQHRRAARSAASAAAGAISPSAALHGPSATARPRRAATSRPRKAPEPTRTTGASGASVRCTRRA